MKKHNTLYFSARTLAAVVAIVMMLWLEPGNIAMAASSWSPTLLVNTESFQVIDDGSGSSDVYIQFGNTLNERITFNRSRSRFEFSDDLSVLGTLSGTTLRVDGNAGIGGNLSASGTLKIDGATTLNGATTVNGTTTVNGDAKVRGSLSGTTLNVDGNSVLKGSLSTSGAITTNGNLGINSDNDTNDATLTFGNQTTAQTVKFSHANQRFEFSKDVKVTGGVRASGNLSGSTLNVDGTINWRGQAYTAPTSQTANTFLKTDGAGALTWSAVTLGNGSGAMRSLHPGYEGAVYYQSGSTAVGQLVASGSGVGDNFYRWSTSQGTLQDYWIKVRVQVPKNFVHWETASGITVRVRSAGTSAANNYATFRVLDTAGTAVTLGNNAQQVSTTANTWRTNTLTGLASGTYTPLGYITLLIKTAAVSGSFMDIGSIDLRWTTTTP